MTRTVRLIRAVTEPGDRGPTRGQFAIQKALAAAKIPWLQIGGEYQAGEIPWLWSWEDINIAVVFKALNLPYIIGPNMLFLNSANPGSTPQEKELLAANSCLLVFTESNWYAETIRRACPTQPGLPLAIFRYPIDPPVSGPTRTKYDVLVYIKENRIPAVIQWSTQRWLRCAVIAYGQYKRDELLAAARASRCCIYFSTDDRGPLAAAEIALAGCPLVGIERGCPWVTNPDLGVRISTLHPDAIEQAVGQAFLMSRQRVRCAAEQYFSAETAVCSIRTAIEMTLEQ